MLILFALIGTKDHANSQAFKTFIKPQLKALIPIIGKGHSLDAITLRVFNPGSDAAAVVVNANLKQYNGKILTLARELNTTIPANSWKNIRFSAKNRANLLLDKWRPNLPYREDYIPVLAELSLTLDVLNGPRIATKTLSIGSSDSQVSGEDISLSGVQIDPYRLKPTHSPQDETNDTLLSQLKNSGNGLEVSIAQISSLLLSSSDRLGVPIVIRVPEYRKNVNPSMLAKFIELAAGHPSVAYWSVPRTSAFPQGFSVLQTLIHHVDPNWYVQERLNGALVSAHFLGADRNTAGSWVGKYGNKAFLIPVAEGTSSSQQAGIEIWRGKFRPGEPITTDEQIEMAKQVEFKKLARGEKTEDVRVLQRGPGTKLRSPVAFSSLGNNLSFRIVAPRSRASRLSLYLLDFTRKGKSDRVDIFDRSGKRLASVVEKSQSNGVYLRFQINGNVCVEIHSLSNEAPVASGIFVD